MTLGKGMAPFSSCGPIETNSAAKELTVTNINMKAGPPNRQIGLLLNGSFLCQNEHYLVAAMNFDVSSLSTLFALFKITNDSL